MLRRIAIFASGRGSNAAKILEYFEGDSEVDVALIVSNKNNAKVLDLAFEHKIPSRVLSKKVFYNSDALAKHLKSQKIDLIVLAGFLWLIPPTLIEAFPDKILNIHPALLPKYGGKNMYGINVHKAVRRAKEKRTGITIHLVDEKYDTGKILFKKSLTVKPEWTAEQIAEAVLKLEHKFYPQVIDKLLKEA